VVKTNMDISNEDLKSSKVQKKKRRRWAWKRINSPSLSTLYLPYGEPFASETYCPRITEARGVLVCSSQIVIETMAWIRRDKLIQDGVPRGRSEGDVHTDIVAGY